MRKLRVLARILKRTGAHRIALGFLLFLFICGVVIWIREPGITRLTDALWYCYTVVTTIGFGDVTVTTRLSRILSVLLSVYAVLVIAIVTGVVVNYYNQIVALKQKQTLSAFVDKLEHLPELSTEELEDLSDRVRKYVEHH